MDVKLILNIRREVSVSRRSFGTSQSPLGLEKIWEELSLASNKKLNVSS